MCFPHGITLPSQKPHSKHSVPDTGIFRLVVHRSSPTPNRRAWRQHCVMAASLSVTRRCLDAMQITLASGDQDPKSIGLLAQTPGGANTIAANDNRLLGDVAGLAAHVDENRQHADLLITRRHPPRPPPLPAAEPPPPPPGTCAGFGTKYPPVPIDSSTTRATTVRTAKANRGSRSSVQQ